jgi:hypothetical protein
MNQIIAKNLAVGAAFSRDSRLQGAPAKSAIGVREQLLVILENIVL